VRILTLLLAAGLLALAGLAEVLWSGSPLLGLQQGVLAGVAVLLALASWASKAWARRALIAFASASGALVLCEIVLRVGFADRLTTVYRIDARLLHSLIPGARKTAGWDGHDVLVRINAVGCRGPELATGGSRPRIVVFGDSCVAAEFSREEATFVHRLGKELNTDCGSVETVNAGVVAYGPDQMCLRMEQLLPELRPDLVVAVVFADNDFGDLIRNKLFAVDGSGQLRERHPILGDYLAKEFNVARNGFVTARALARVLHRREQPSLEPGDGSPVSERRLRHWLAQCREELASYSWDDNVTNLMDDHYDADLSLQPDSAAAATKRALMDGVLGRMAHVARSAEVPLLLVLLPSPIDVCESSDLATVDPEQWPDYERDAKTGWLAERSAAHGVPCVDLFGPFRRHGPEKLYLGGVDNHWNDAGQALAARLVAQAIRELDLLRGDG